MGEIERYTNVNAMCRSRQPTAHLSATSFAQSDALLSCNEDSTRFCFRVHTYIQYVRVCMYECVCACICLEKVLDSCSTPLPHNHLLTPPLSSLRKRL